MYWVYYSLALSIHYLFDVIFSKYQAEKYDLRKIIINTYLISVLVLLAFFPKDIIFKPDVSYIFIILFALNLLFGIFVWYHAIVNKLNLGKMDGLALAIYLPILTLASLYIFKQKMITENYVGIVFIAIGAYLILKE